MDKFIPYENLSKKEKRKMDLAKRQTWGELNPVTRKPQNSKAYNRNKSRNWRRDYQRTNSGTFYSNVAFKSERFSITQGIVLRNSWHLYCVYRPRGTGAAL